MRTPINFPKAGMGIEEGTVVRWLKRIGDPVQVGEPIVELETAKAIQEVEAPATGNLTQILRAEGEVAAVNTALGIIEEA